MNKLFSMSGTFLLTMGITMSGWAASPCMPIARACMEQGYYKGGKSQGKGLIENCVMPVVQNQKTLPNTNFDAQTLQSCGVVLMKKMQAQQGKQQ